MKYLTHAELGAQLRAWADAYPDLVELSSIGASAEGRELWLLTIGTDRARTRPAVWIDGNMHAMELCGSAAALRVAEQAIALHQGPIAGLSQAAQERLRDVVFHVLPRMSPDGAEAVLTTGRFVRSRPHDARKNAGRARFRLKDVDGDGTILWMRRQDDAGDFVASTATPGLMIPRTIDDEGPFYKLMPEGVLEGWDGRHVPAWHFLADGPDDFNRNFPWSWAPSDEQEGAGEYPGSAPEVRAVLDFAAAHPNLYVWMNLHTFGGVFIRPLGHQPDAKMDAGDRAVFRQMEEWAKTFTGYPTVSGFEEFCYVPERPLRGDISDFAYHQRGCLAVSVELWDFFARVGLPAQKPFVETYTRFSRDELERFAAWDRAQNGGRCFRPWRRCEHPQLGVVEVGGLDPRVGVWNPPEALLPEVCDGLAAVFLRMAAMLPRVVVAAEATTVGPGARRVDVVVRNTGYLATHGLPSAKKLAISEPLTVEVEGQGGARVRAPARVEIGHLDGWGRGRFGPMQAPPYQATTMEQTERATSFVVEGDGPVRVRVGSCRTGVVDVAPDTART